MKFGLALVCLGFLASACATTPPVSPASTAYRPAVDFSSWRSALAGPTTKVATLGSQHLAELPNTIAPEALQPLLDKLAAFNPTIITHEGLSGEQCDMIQRHPTIYPEIYTDYCGGVMLGVRASGPSLPQARANVEETLKTWPASPTPAQRRRLASLFLASGDPPSAQVQWLQLPASERIVGDGIDRELLEVMAKIEKRQNETNKIGVALAVRLGLQRMYAIDDHTSDSIQALAPEGFGVALRAHWTRPSNAEVPAVKQYKALAGNMNSGEGVLAAFRFLNTPETQRAFVELDYRDALAAQSPQLFGRQYVSWFETRNLRMVANIRSAFGNSPGARVLNIVGASHKAYYEAYLAQMSEVELVDMATILR
jgi:Family of unknown function (DUF5694)